MENLYIYQHCSEWYSDREKVTMSRKHQTAEADGSVIRSLKRKVYLANHEIATVIGDCVFAKWIFCYWYDELANDLSKVLTGDSAFDIGCGPGDLIFAMNKRHPQVEFKGIDISKSIIKRAKKRLSKFQYENVSFIHTLDDKIPFQNESQSFGFSTFSFHLWKNPHAILSEIYRVLQKDSVFVLLDFNGAEEFENKNIDYLNGLAKQATGILPYLIKGDIQWGYKTVGLYDEQETKELISKSPFSNFTIHSRPVHISPENFFIETRLYK